MHGIETAYCDVCIQAVIAAWRSIYEAPASELLSKVPYGKGDTLGFDAIPEIVIQERLKKFDPHSILITEELNTDRLQSWPTSPEPIQQPLVSFADPTDRSKYLKKFLEHISNDQATEPIGKILKSQQTVKIWEELFEPPGSITGATSAITCLRKGVIIFSVILNYISQTIYVACRSGIFMMQLPDFDSDDIDNIFLDRIMKNGQNLQFPQIKYSTDDAKSFVTFVGKTGYNENLEDSLIFTNLDGKKIHHREPGGPARILYLSELQQSQFNHIGFILANGEKIGEWIHWLAFVKFSHAGGSENLKIFEISLDRPWTKDGVLMSTSLPYSMFRDDKVNGVNFLDISRLRPFDNPSKFRSMLVVTPASNERMLFTMRQRDFREIILK
ncbi:MAG: hypothetical protein COU22_01655 [Candidatus Komeilibacteria bacterium CG10_big_fil_rev_8_21_14_0_10_41_13]|uniref:Uncharacterized protein n=1 Tax=Candidatus Komeilibacteria bacterium CG10_big_fil_rev_8_21_14_0_10_41_13 TaxID=1974476 RepID=A0A2M6WCL1_9BACT|nr:MAG: hypothetical protein COU22_01655 [Candidatus Komeilibacteria bacterium CG10_big_fil_rev_8_21_14_0_10_41_13]